MTDIFEAEFIDQIAMRGGPTEPDNWKRYRDDAHRHQGKLHIEAA